MRTLFAVFFYYFAEVIWWPLESFFTESNIGAEPAWKWINLAYSATIKNGNLNADCDQGLATLWLHIKQIQYAPFTSFAGSFISRFLFSFVGSVYIMPYTFYLAYPLAKGLTLNVFFVMQRNFMNQHHVMP